VSAAVIYKVQFDGKLNREKRVSGIKQSPIGMVSLIDPCWDLSSLDHRSTVLVHTRVQELLRWLKL